jgi:RNA polymerase sigma-70 factor (ECF subfamily)
MDEPRGDRGGYWDWPRLAAAALLESRRVLGHSQDAEDAAQEAMIRAFKSRGRCLNQRAPEAWVRTIARREAYRQFTAARADQAVPPVVERPEEPAANSVHDTLAAREVLSRVPANDRPLLVRRYLFGQSSAEIGAELSLSPATVRVRLHRALKRLRECEPGWT